MDIDVIGVPLYYGCDRKGAELGPDKLREKKIIDVISKHHHQVIDKGDISVKEISNEDKYKEHPKMKYLNEIIKVNSKLAHEVYKSLSENHFPLILGGDHALGLGSVSGASQFFKEIAVIWIDAHGDINTEETSPSGNIHGMPLAAALGAGNKKLRNVYFDGLKVRPENIFIMGARDLDPGEVLLAEEKNINIYSMEQVKKQGLKAVLESVVQEIESKNVKAVHLSYDLDSMDGSLVPGTGLPISDGFSVKEIKLLLKRLFETSLVRSMDIVELNPLLDEADTTAELAIDLIDFVFDLLAHQEH